MIPLRSATSARVAREAGAVVEVGDQEWPAIRRRRDRDEALAVIEAQALVSAGAVAAVVPNRRPLTLRAWPA